MPREKRKPGFYWVRVTRFGLKVYPRKVIGEYSRVGNTYLWQVLGWDEAHFDDGSLEVLSERLLPPKEKKK